jgi:hypothetical protein
MLYYPPENVDMDSTVLSISKQTIIDVEGEEMHVLFQNWVVEGGRGWHLASIYD